MKLYAVWVSNTLYFTNIRKYNNSIHFTLFIIWSYKERAWRTIIITKEACILQKKLIITFFLWGISLFYSKELSVCGTSVSVEGEWSWESLVDSGAERWWFGFSVDMGWETEEVVSPFSLFLALPLSSNSVTTCTAESWGVVCTRPSELSEAVLLVWSIGSVCEAALTIPKITILTMTPTRTKSPRHTYRRRTVLSSKSDNARINCGRLVFLVKLAERPKKCNKFSLSIALNSFQRHAWQIKVWALDVYWLKEIVIFDEAVAINKILFILWQIIYPKLFILLAPKANKKILCFCTFKNIFTSYQ